MMKVILNKITLLESLDINYEIYVLWLFKQLFIFYIIENTGQM